MTRRPLHPFLFALFPVVFLYGRNAAHVPVSEAVVPAAVVLGVTAAVLGVGGLVFRDVRRAAVATSVAAVVVLSYGHVWQLVAGRSALGSVWGRDLVLLPLAAVIVLGGVLLASRLRDPDTTTRLLNALGAGLVVVALVGAGTAVAGLDGAADAPARSVAPAPSAASDADRRDIYFIVFDRYGGRQVLADYFDLDTRPFLHALRARGFYVADRSTSNYNKTAHSLAATLNLDHLDAVAREHRTSKDWSHLYRMLTNPRAVRTLRANGWSYAHIGSWWEPTSHDRTADVNYHYSEARRSEFSRLLVRTTILEAIAKRVGGPLGELDFRRVQHEQILYQFDAIPQAGARPGPTFVFAHLLLPHEPYTFDADGRYVTEEQERSRSFVRNYREQVRFTNRKILELVDELLDVPADRRPVIVLNADEGPNPVIIDVPPGTKGWEPAAAEAARFKFPILNAMLLPGVATDALYPSITPVNTFRVIFDAYLGTSLGLLPDRRYVYASDDRPYELHEVTTLEDAP